jgi:small GTP-binding protein
LLQPEYREAFEQDLLRLHALSGPWELVIISGNLTQTGRTSEFDLLNSTLISLWKYLQRLGSDPDLLVVPGSNDFRRRRLSPDGKPAKAEYRAASVRSALQDTDDKNQLGEAVWDGLSPFLDWFNAWKYSHPQDQSRTTFFRKGLLPGDFAATLFAKELKVGVVGLNALFRNVPPSRPGSAHEVDVAQLEPAMLQGTRQWALEHDLMLLVTHPPPAELRRQQLEAVLEAVAPLNGMTLHLCGKGNQILGAISADKPVINLQSPSLFGVEPGNEQSSAAWGYMAGEVELQASRLEGRLRLFPRIASLSAGSVRLIPDESQLLLQDEAFTLELEQLFKAPFGGDTILEKLSSPSAPETNAPPDIRVTKEALSTVQVTPPGVKLQQVLTTGREAVRVLAWDPSNDALALGLSDGHLAYWQLGEEFPLWTVKAHATEVVDLCFSPDGLHLASCTQDHTRLCFSDNGLQFSQVGLEENRGGCLSWSSEGWLAVGSKDGAVELPTHKEPFEPTQLDTNILGLHVLAWSPDGRTLACAGVGDSTVMLWHSQENMTSSMRFGTGHQRNLLSIAWMPAAPLFATASFDSTIRIWDTKQQMPVAVLEGHTDAVINVSFSFDGRLLASKSLDGSVRLFRTDTWEQVAQLEEPVSHLTHGGLAFSPTQPVLASLGAGGRAVRLWDIDIETLLRKPTTHTVHTASAKVVLVGEGRVGKSCLALRMSKDSYEELGATHGMQFWSLPAEPPQPGHEMDSPMRREVILWDMGGQEEYRLVHQLFMRDSTVALMVMEPGRGRTALDELEGWDQRLLAQTGERTIRKLLVGTKVDDAQAPVDPTAIEHFVRQRQFLEYVLTSARTGKGIPELKSALSRAIDWESLEKVSRPELFEHLRQYIQRLRESRRVVIPLLDLQEELGRDLQEPFDLEALRAVVAHLARQGLVADTRMADGTQALILEVEQIERYAGSLILAARDNPHGVPALDVAKMHSPTARFPRIKPEERLRRDQELVVLDCVIQLLIEHGLCLRHEGLLIFPSLFRPNQSDAGSDLPRAVSLHYDFSGPIDNIYASLITSLALSQHFGPVRLWEARAEFGRAGEHTCGVQRIQQSGQSARGLARLDVYFDDNTPPATRELFVSLIEEHLRVQGVSLVEQFVISCVCGKVFPREDVTTRIELGHSDIGCMVCDRRTPLSPGAQQSQQRNPELAGQLQALRTRIREQRSQSITETKVSMTEAQRDTSQQGKPLRILHLSDLHVGSGDDPIHLLQPLMDDLRDEQEGLGVERLDYLVISGDITNRAAPEEFEQARKLVSGLIQEFGLTAERCIIVPGNHDLHWDTEVYTFKKKRQVTPKELVAGRYREQGDGYMVREEARYSERFRNFSQHFYHPLLQKEYPLSPEQQCLPSLFSETRLQFLAMNSAWEIDEYFPERSSIHEGALARGLEAANQQLTSAIQSGALARDARVLRLAVWHHPVTGNEKIAADAFMERLARANVRACLHGHVHEDRAALVNHLHPTQKVHIVGAGSFGAPTAQRPESVPRLFNLLEVERDLSRLRVHTRCLRKQGGAWEGWAVWPGAGRGEKRTYYDVPLP